MHVASSPKCLTWVHTVHHIHLRFDCALSDNEATVEAGQFWLVGGCSISASKLNFQRVLSLWFTRQLIDLVCIQLCLITLFFVVKTWLKVARAHWLSLDCFQLKPITGNQAKVLLSSCLTPHYFIQQQTVALCHLSLRQWLTDLFRVSRHSSGHLGVCRIDFNIPSQAAVFLFYVTITVTPLPIRIDSST